MSLHTEEIDAAWDKLGMVISNTGDRHAKLYYEGKLILATKRSFGRGAIEGPVQYLIRQQLKLNENQFKELMACPLKLPEYIAILKQKRLISETPKRQENAQDKRERRRET